MRSIIIKSLISASTILLSATITYADTPLKIMSWNIANLASEPGVSLRKGSHIRAEADYKKVINIIQSSDADIIALQEIGSHAGARKVLGENYDFQFESRCEPEKCQSDHGDIYTAIAWKKELPIQNVKPVFLDGLSIEHVSDCQYDETRKVRSGVGIKFEHQQKPITVVSIHLKASCADEKANDPDARPGVQDDCAVVDEQIAFLGNWIRNTINTGMTVVVAGDYNRKFLKLNDRHAKSLKAVVPGLKILPEEESQCWPKNYPQSAKFRTGKAFRTFKNVEGDYFWQPYMPSSIGSRDFFLVAGPVADTTANASEILMRPKQLVHNPEDNQLSKQQRIQIEQQAAGVGVRFEEPNGYIKACKPDMHDDTNLWPEPQPFSGGNRVLFFSNIHPSDHCPITMEIGKTE